MRSEPLKGRPRVAIVGVSGALPGSSDIEDFFERSRRGDVLSSEKSPGQWPLCPSSEKQDSYPHRKGFFLDHIPSSVLLALV